MPPVPRVCRRRAPFACLLAGAALCAFGTLALLLAYGGGLGDDGRYKFQRAKDAHGEPEQFAVPHMEQDEQSADGRNPVPVAAAPSIDLAPDVPMPDYRTHAFYYPWYGNPEWDEGVYYHWNHPRLPHWNRAEARRWPLTSHRPPLDIGSSFYPMLGCYSSHDEHTLHQHMRWMRQSGVGVVVTSYYPKGQADPQGRPWHGANRMLFDIAHKYRLKVTFHMEPYEQRTAVSMKDNAEQIHAEFGGHPAFYKHWRAGAALAKPMYYVYDSYRIEPEGWQEVLQRGSVNSVRGTIADGYFMALLLNDKDKHGIVSAGFDGFYTYFAATGFSDGSTPSGWPGYRVFAKKNKLMFSPSVGPGYDDVTIRPWNGKTERKRDNGSYYESMFASAIGSRPDVITITSFNEWHEGTQIEPAVAKKNEHYTYVDYGANGPDFYLNLTRKLVRQFVKVRGEPTVD